MLFISGLLYFSIVNTVSASEGTFELRSTDDNNYKCYAASLLMQNLNYKIILSCRNILFPVDETIFTYMLWANPSAGGKPVKIGSVGLGKGEYATKVAFASLFVTTEQNVNTKEPAGNVVMKGSIKPILFLEKEITDSSDEKTEDGEEKISPSPTPKVSNLSTRERLITGFKRAGLATGLALVSILGLVFVLTRPR
ncbi:MAG: hypothetical protein US95_C0003G0029 [Candidatus Woesebacteria bacterium GW2011_GWB1_38_5]|uniref:Uncharacterized protein n=2 Tax=Candidatus Woeseibacteriota TaxID=1752722 RepID=A0A0G0K9E3_9BACT|nr:MAG: hypothetical protein US95_C0003G0029 [Candidatus Woesebacteria bacterium GW2011_GWB1_38_5]KKQ75773.1 MAG: hypothetical protein US97_C0032G0002 [Microgenomates group bacterium GW2011_GWF1_38_5]KKQ84014.1 MAG: hypothetical protein UT06_C0011G0003 [Candidatus Woesebacteria bacterium GW2011_GWA1_38_8]